MKRRSIRTILRRTFLFLAAVTLILLSAIFSVFQYQTLKSQAVRISRKAVTVRQTG